MLDKWDSYLYSINMELRNIAEEVAQIEERIILNIELLEIAKSYCEYNFDKASEVSTLGAILDVILREQKALADSFDGYLIKKEV